MLRANRLCCGLIDSSFVSVVRPGATVGVDTGGTASRGCRWLIAVPGVPSQPRDARKHLSRVCNNSELLSIEFPQQLPTPTSRRTCPICIRTVADAHARRKTIVHLSTLLQGVHQNTSEAPPLRSFLIPLKSGQKNTYQAGIKMRNNVMSQGVKH